MTVHVEFIKRFHIKWSTTHQTANSELDAAVNSLLKAIYLDRLYKTTVLPGFRLWSSLNLRFYLILQKLTLLRMVEIFDFEMLCDMDIKQSV